MSQFAQGQCVSVFAPISCRVRLGGYDVGLLSFRGCDLDVDYARFPPARAQQRALPVQMQYKRQM